MTKSKGVQFLKKYARKPRQIVSFYCRSRDGRFSSEYISTLPLIIDKTHLFYNELGDCRASTLFLVELSRINFATLHKGW